MAQSLQITNHLMIFSLLNGVCFPLSHILLTFTECCIVCIIYVYVCSLRSWCIFRKRMWETGDVSSCCWWYHNDVSTIYYFSSRSWGGTVLLSIVHDHSQISKYILIIFHLNFIAAVDKYLWTSTKGYWREGGRT